MILKKNIGVIYLVGSITLLIAFMVAFFSDSDERNTILIVIVSVFLLLTLFYIIGINTYISINEHHIKIKKWFKAYKIDYNQVFHIEVYKPVRIGKNSTISVIIFILKDRTKITFNYSGIIKKEFIQYLKGQVGKDKIKFKGKYAGYNRKQVLIGLFGSLIVSVTSLFFLISHLTNYSDELFLSLVIFILGVCFTIYFFVKIKSYQ